MKISKATTYLINDLNQFSNSKLKNIEDISLIIETSSLTQQQKLLNEILFTAKYLNGLGKILQKNLPLNSNKNGSLGSDDIDRTKIKITKEFEENIQNLISKLRFLFKNIKIEDKEKFENKYFSLTRSSMINLTILIYDLAWLKTYRNKNK